MLPTPHTRKCLFSSAKCVVIRCTVRCITWGEKEQNNNVHKCKVSCFCLKKLLHSIVCRQSYDRKNRVIAHCRHPQLRDKKSEREGERECYLFNSLNEKRIKVHETKCLMRSGRIKFLFHQLVSICSGR